MDEMQMDKVHIFQHFLCFVPLFRKMSDRRPVIDTHTLKGYTQAETPRINKGETFKDKQTDRIDTVRGFAVTVYSQEYKSVLYYHNLSLHLILSLLIPFFYFCLFVSPLMSEHSPPFFMSSLPLHL